MKTRTLLFYLVFAALTLAFNGCGSQDKKSTTSETIAKDSTMKGAYYCPMDPEVQSDKPGKCPKCGMDLEKREDVKTDTTTTKK